MVERRELAGKVERLGIGGRSGGDETDPARGDGKSAEHREGLEPSACRLRDIIGEVQLVGEKDRVQPGLLGPLRQVAIVVDIRQRQRRCARMAPGRLVMAAALNEQIEMNLALHR